MPKKTKKIKLATRLHNVLVDNNLPFKHRVEPDRTKYTRKQKHSKRNID